MCTSTQEVVEAIRSAPEFAGNADWPRLSQDETISPRVRICARRLGRLMQLFFLQSAPVGEWDRLDRFTVRAAKDYATAGTLEMDNDEDVLRWAFLLLKRGWRYSNLLGKSAF